MNNISFEQQLSGFGVSLHRAIIDQLIGQIESAISNGRIRSKDGQCSVYDFIREVLSKKGERKVWKRFTEEFSAVVLICHDWQFPGERQRKTPVTDLAGLVYIAYFSDCEYSHQLRAASANYFVSERQSAPVEPERTPDPIESLERSLEATRDALHNYPFTIDKLWRDSGIVNKSQVKGAVLRDFIEGRDYTWADEILCVNESTYYILMMSFRSLKGADISQLPEIIRVKTKEYFQYHHRKKMNKRTGQQCDDQLSLF